MKRRRKSRLSRSGVVSTRIRPGMAASLRSAPAGGRDVLRRAAGRGRGRRCPRPRASRWCAAARRCRRRRRRTDPQKNVPSGPRRKSTSGGDLLGPAGTSDRDGQHVEHRSGLGVGPHAGHHRRVDHAGGDGVEPESRPGPVGPGGVPAHPVGHGELGGGVGHQGPAGVGDLRTQLLVVAQAGLDEVGRDGGLHGGRVRADGHGGAARARGAGADPRARPPCRSSSRRPAASPARPGRPASPAQVTMPSSTPPQRSVACSTASRRPPGVDRSATMSDSSLSMPMTSPACGAAAALARGGTDARGGAGDDDGAVRQRGAPSGGRAPCRRAQPMETSEWMTSRTVRSVSMTKVIRLTLRKLTLRFTPSWAATARSGSDRSGKPSDSFSSNCFCLSTVSALMPTGWAPDGGELAGQVAEVAALLGAAVGHGGRVEEQHHGPVGEEPAQRPGRSRLVGEREVGNDVAFLHPLNVGRKRRGPCPATPRSGSRRPGR